MDDLQRVGLSLIAENASKYVSDLDKATQSNSKFFESLSKAPGAASSFNSVTSNLTSNLNNLAKTTAHQTVNSFTSSAQGAATAAGAASAPAQTLFGHLTNLAKTTAHTTLSAIGGAASGAVGGITSFAGSVGGAAVSGLNSLVGSAKNALGAVVDLGVKAAETGIKIGLSLGKKSIDLYQDFSQVVSEAGATSGLTGQALDDFKKQAEATALELGAKLPVSSKEAAQAILELSKAGFDAKASIASAGATAKLSTAANIDMGKSAGIVSNAMNQFGLDMSTSEAATKNAQRVVDLLSKTANASAVDVTDLSMSFKYVGPAASAAGYSIEDMSKALGVLGNAGIKGSQAGTSLRSIITRLAAPTKDSAAAIEALGLKVTDSSGKMRPFQDVVMDLRAKFKGLSQVEQIDLAKKLAGQEAMGSLLALVNTTDDSFNAMSTAVDNAAGTADKLSDAFNNTLKGSTENMKGSIESLQIKFGKGLAPVMTIINNRIADLANRAGPFADAFGSKVASAIGTLTTDLGLLKKAFEPLVTAIDAFKKTLGGNEQTSNFNKKLIDINQTAADAHPVITKIGEVVTNVIVPAFQKGTQLFTEFETKFGSLASKALTLYSAISPIGTVLNILNGFLQGGLAGGLQAFEAQVQKIGSVFGIDLTGAINGFNGFVTSTLLPALGEIGNFISTQVIPAVSNFATFIGTNVIPVIGQIGSFIVTQVIPALGSFASFFFTDVVPQVGNFLTWLGATFAPIFNSAVTVAVQTVIPALQTFASWFTTTLLPALSNAATFIATTFGPAIQSIATFIANPVIPMIGQFISVVLTQVIPMVAQWIGVIATGLKPILQSVASFITTIVVPAFTAIANFISTTLIPVFSQVIAYISNNILPKLSELANFLGQTVALAFNNLQTVITTVWGLIENTIKTTVGVITGIFNTISAFLKGDFSGAWNAFKGVIDTVWNGIQTAINTAWTAVQGVFNNIVSFLSGTLGKGFTDLQTGVGTVWDNITTGVGQFIEGVKTKFNDVITFFTDLPGNIIKAIGDLGGSLFKAGGDAIAGFIKGFSNVHIPMPHFNITMGSGPFGIPVPNVDVQWYARGGIFNGPQVAGIGEAGPEAVLPLARLVPLLSSALREVFSSNQMSPSASASQISQAAYYNNMTTMTTNQYQLSVNTPLDSNSVISDFALMQAWGAS